jgi:hypothetical protein
VFWQRLIAIATAPQASRPLRAFKSLSFIPHRRCPKYNSISPGEGRWEKRTRRLSACLKIRSLRRVGHTADRIRPAFQFFVKDTPKIPILCRRQVCADFDCI